MNVAFAVAIAHAPWKPGRVESYERLVRSLSPALAAASGLVAEIWTEQEKAASSQEWAGRIWERAVRIHEHGPLRPYRPTHLLVLEDDNIVAPGFWPALLSLVETYPDDVIGLRSFHPMGAMLGVSTYTSADCMTGEYVLPMGKLAEFLKWRSECKADVLEKIGCDTTIAIWCQAMRYRIRHTNPALIDHDVSLPSTYGHLGNDSHQYRRPSVPFEGIEIPSSWELEAGQEECHVGRLWGPCIQTLEALGKPPSRLLRSQILGDTGSITSRKLAYAHAASVTYGERIWIGMPTVSGMHEETALSIFSLIHSGLSLRFDPMGIGTRGDLLLARSRLLANFLLTDATHALLLDADVSFPPHLIGGMLAAKRDIVLAPYARRGHLDLEAGRRAPPEVPAAAAAYSYKLRMIKGAKHLDLATDAPVAEIRGFGLGLALVSRHAIERMNEVHGAACASWDEETGDYAALFDPLNQPDEQGHPIRLRDDFAFCERARLAGLKVWLYLGPGAPAVHHGDHAYKGAIESFGVSHVRKDAAK